MTLSAVSAVALVCSYANTLMGMIGVGSTALVQYNNVPVSCCNIFTSLAESAGLVVSSSTYCVLVPYIGEFQVCGACSGSVGGACWYLCRAALMYPGIDKSTVRFCSPSPRLNHSKHFPSSPLKC
jgi:hypothetical protein